MTGTPPLDVGTLIRDALRGRFPAEDGGWSHGRSWRPGVGAVLSFTAHAVIVPARGETHADLDALDPHGFGGAALPHVVTALAGPGGWIDNLDALLVRASAQEGAGGVRLVGPQGAGGVRLVDRPDLHDHPRAALARTIRDDVRTLGVADPTSRAVVTLSRGLGGLAEVGIESDGSVDARAVLQAVDHFVPAGEPIVAAVAPGNARSLRAFLGAGWAPIGSVQVFRPADD